MRDPLGLTPRQRTAADAAREPFDPRQVEIITIAPDVANYRITDQGRYCPAPIPCLGRPGVGVAIDVRRKVNGELRDVVNVVYATLCVDCRQWAQDNPTT